ncbi:MAG TPA: hypothetical protein PKO22_11500 [Treponemataceae bacterium]|nr:hypothetical protein [Treponemataceae bacterium]
MKEMTEIRIGDDRLALQDNLVKTGIIPKSSKELERSVTIQGNVILEGAVYGKNIIIENGPATFQGAVYAHNELHIQSDATGSLKFMKAVGSTASIVGIANSARPHFGADINSKSVRLKNAFVAASIFGDEVSLDNCVVLGGVFATKKLTVQNCIVGTFNSPEVSAGGINYLLYPTAFSVEPISSLPGTEFFNLSIADLGSLYKEQKEKPMTGKIRLDIKKDSQRTVLIDAEKNSILVNSYSVSGKVLILDMLDIEKMENHFLLNAASLGSQLLKTYSFPESSAPELTLENISEFFFKILDGRIQVQNVDGSISMDELKKLYN